MELPRQATSIADRRFWHFQMRLNNKLLLELQSIGLYPESVPNLVDDKEDEAIKHEIDQLNIRLRQQNGKKKVHLEKICKGIGSSSVKRDLEKVAIDRLVELAYRKYLEIAERNTKNRENLCAYPRTGRTSFPVIVEEMKELNLQVDQLGIFRYTRQKNNEYCIDDGAADLEGAIQQKLNALPLEKQSDEDERNKIFRKVVGQDGHGRSLCMGTGIRPTTKRAKVSHDKELEEEVVILKEKMAAQQEHMENQEKRHQEQMENQEKRHQLEVANIYKLQNAGILTQEVNGGASNSNQNTSNQ